MLVILDTMLSEYGWELEYVMDKPLVTLFALYTACAERHGMETVGPSYMDQELLRALRTTREGKKGGAAWA